MDKTKIIDLVLLCLDRLESDGARIPADLASWRARHKTETFAATPSGKAKTAVNKYQLDLEGDYQDWAEDTAAKLAAASSDSKREEVLAAALLLLLALLKRKGKDAIPEAAVIALSGADPIAAIDDLVSDAISENDDYLSDSLIPDIEKKVKAGLLDPGIIAALAAGEGAAAFLALLQTETSRVGSYSGEWWKTYNSAVGLVADENGSKVTSYLDPRADHCGECPEFAETGGKVYGSWKEYQDATGGRVPGEFECGPNCRCWLEFG